MGITIIIKATSTEATMQPEYEFTPNPISLEMGICILPRTPTGAYFVLILDEMHSQLQRAFVYIS